jgi:DNA-binding NarL/FixJ family response regulator
VIGAVRDGEELVKAAMSLQPDVIVTDVFIPGLSGLDAQTSLHEQGCDIPFVFVSIDPTLKSYLSPGLGVCITKADLRSCLNLEVRAAAIQRITPTDNKLLGASISREVQ